MRSRLGTSQLGDGRLGKLLPFSARYLNTRRTATRRSVIDVKLAEIKVTLKLFKLLYVS